MTIFKPTTPQYFGDLWRYVSFATSVSAERGECVWLDLPAERLAVAWEMALELKSKGWINFKFGGAEPLRIADTFGRPLLPTCRQSIRKFGARSHVLAYRLNNHYEAEKKSAPKEHVEMFLDQARAWGWRPLELPRSASIEELISIAAAADFCLCTNTGVTQLCYSVGVPVYVVKYAASEHAVQEWDAQAAGVFADVPAFLAGGLRRGE